MKREFYNQHSEVLGEDMSMIVYGEGGYPVIAFQAQDAKSNNFEDFGMIDVLAPFIDEGRIQVFSVDNLDEESWSDEGGDKGARAWRQEEYFRFVTDELIPRVHAWNNSDRRPIAVGCSMGATHAAIAAFRRPDLFQGCIALSGVYRTGFFFGDWMDENLYNNDIPAFLTNMAADHPYVDLYNQRQLVMCVGQGAWEAGVDDLRYIDSQLDRLGVKHWCDFWGTDVNHDWPWWRKQMPYFMNEVLNDIEAAAAAPAPQPEVKAEPEAKAEAEAKPAAKKTTRRATTRKTTAKATTTKKAAAEASDEATAEAEEPKPAAKRTTRRSTAKKAENVAEAAASEEQAAPASTAKKTTRTRKTTTTKAAGTKTTTAKATTKTTTAKAAGTKAATAKKAAAKASDEATASTEESKPAAKRTTRRSTAKKTDATE